MAGRQGVPRIIFRPLATLAILCQAISDSATSPRAVSYRIAAYFFCNDAVSDS